VDLFKALFLIAAVPAWSAQIDTRLAKAPKAFMVDTGLLCYLCGLDAESLARDVVRYGPVLKTFALNDLRRLAAVSRVRPWIFHLRTVKQKEVDFVLEGRDGRVVGIEVRADKAARPEDLDGLRFLAELAGDRFHRGVVLYDGAETVEVGERMAAMPLASLWS
jgi:hypothetical protein